MTHDRSFLHSFSKKVALLILSGVVLSVSCRPGHEDRAGNPDGKPVIFVSLAPQAFLVKAIAEPEFDVRILVEPGQDPHHWLPSPKQVLALSKAEIWFPSGLPFEKDFLPEWESGKSTLVISRAIADFVTNPSPHDNHNNEIDSHTWLDPVICSELVLRIADTLSHIDPANEKLYRDRCKFLKTKIISLHNKLTEQLTPFKGRSFLIFHDALGHFAHAYGLSQNVIQHGDASHNPNHLREIISQAKQDKTTVVFIQPQFDNRSAHIIAEAIGGRVVIIDPLAEDVLANLKHIADTLTDSFSQARP